MKKISFPAKPSNHLSPEDWIGDKHSTAPGEPMKRLTIDVPRRLHKRIKSQCAIRGENMADEIRKLLEVHFPEEYHQEGAANTMATPTPGNTTL
jgi:hypothetical protein